MEGFLEDGMRTVGLKRVTKQSSFSWAGRLKAAGTHEDMNKS
jgi:hypothetical protein